VKKKQNILLVLLSPALPSRDNVTEETVHFETFPMLKICHIIYFFFSYPKSINCFALNWIFRILVASLMFSFSNS